MIGFTCCACRSRLSSSFRTSHSEATPPAGGDWAPAMEERNTRHVSRPDFIVINRTSSVINRTSSMTFLWLVWHNGARLRLAGPGPTTRPECRLIRRRRRTSRWRRTRRRSGSRSLTGQRRTARNSTTWVGRSVRCHGECSVPQALQDFANYRTFVDRALGQRLVPIHMYRLAGVQRFRF